MILCTFRSLHPHCMCILSLYFFFSSRRRHTRSLCDWSSDVCSSDLVIGVLPFLGKTVEEIGHMVPYPIVPARRDARVRGQDPFKHTPPVPTIGSQPVDGPSRYDLDRGASFVEQRRILDRALSTPDHDDVPSLEAAEIPVVGRMGDK